MPDQEQQSTEEMNTNKIDTPASNDAAVIDHGVFDESVEHTDQAEDSEVLEVGVDPDQALQVSETAQTKALVEAPIVEQTQVKDLSAFELMVQKIKTDGTAEQKRLILGIEQYMQRMTPGMQVDFNEGARHQHTLWKMIQGVIERAPQDQFKKMWSILLAYFEEHKDGVFGDRYVYRFSEFWHQGESELNAFQRIINVIKLTSNPQERELGLRQVDLNRSLDEVFTEQGRQRIMAYYQG